MVTVQNKPLALKPAGREKSQSLLTSAAAVSGDWPKHQDGSPDFMQMTSAQRLAYDHARLTRKFG